MPQMTKVHELQTVNQEPCPICICIDKVVLCYFATKCYLIQMQYERLRLTKLHNIILHIKTFFCESQIKELLSKHDTSYSV